MIYDSHIHTRFSPDSQMNPEEALAAASKLGLGLCAAEHVDYECDDDILLVTDTGRYFNEYAEYKSAGLLLGLEIGLTVNTRAIGRKIASNTQNDFCVGSVHVCFGYDTYSSSFWQQRIPLEEIKGRYLKYAVIVIDKCDFFDSLGHIDFPSRYCPFKEKDIKYSTHKILYDQIFTALLDKGKVLEINTKRIHNAEAAQNLYNIYEGYYKMGGRYVTLGSDAHIPGDIGRSFKKALHIIKEIGLTPVHYVQRKMVIDV